MDRPLDRLSDADLFTSPMTFMGAPYGRPGPNNKAAILGIPFDCGTNMRIGARGGPDSVRQQSVLMRRFNPTNADFDPVAALSLVVASLLESSCFPSKRASISWCRSGRRAGPCS